MRSQDDLAPFRRILVALDSSSESLAALETAAWLAGSLRSKLTGLFVEEQDLFHLAALPFSKEVPLAQARARDLDPARLRREMRARATLARQAVEKVALQRKLEWSFEILQGRGDVEITAFSARSDLIAVAREAAAPARIAPVAAQSRRALLVTRHQARPARGPVTVPFDASAGARRALKLAAGLARADGVTIRVLAWGETEAALESLQSAAQACVAGQAPLTFQGTIGPQPGAPPQILCQLDRGLIVLAGDDGLFSPEQIDSLMKNARCPLLILRDEPSE